MNKIIFKIHLYLGLFFLPFALLFIITGLFHVFSVSGSSVTQTKIVAYKDINDFSKLNKEALIKAAIPKLGLISGGTYKYRYRKNVMMENHDYIVAIAPNDAKSYKFVVSKRNLYSKLLRFHVGKYLLAQIGVFAFGFCVLVLFISGFIMFSMRVKSYINSYSLVCIAGLLSLILLIYFG